MQDFEKNIKKIVINISGVKANQDYLKNNFTLKDLNYSHEQLDTLATEINNYVNYTKPSISPDLFILKPMELNSGMTILDIVNITREKLFE